VQGLYANYCFVQTLYFNYCFVQTFYLNYCFVQRFHANYCFVQMFYGSGQDPHFKQLAKFSEDLPISYVAAMC
jgi:hypothetical protein